MVSPQRQTLSANLYLHLLARGSIETHWCGHYQFVQDTRSTEARCYCLCPVQIGHLCERWAGAAMQPLLPIYFRPTSSGLHSHPFTVPPPSHREGIGSSAPSRQYKRALPFTRDCPDFACLKHQHGRSAAPHCGCGRSCAAALLVKRSGRETQKRRGGNCT